MSNLVHYAWLVPFLPLLAAILTAVAGRWLRGWAHIPVIAGIGAACVVAICLLFVNDPKPHVAYDWLNVTGLDVPIVFQVDGLTTMMLAMVTFVATLVAIFAAGYMKGDPGYVRFFALVGLFVFSMTGLVLSGNYVLTYVFWEGVGVCSYLLVGFWYEKPAAAAAAKKAFLVNRIGDFGFAIAIFWMWTVFNGHLDYATILNLKTLEPIADETKMGIGLLLFWAATAKSAQIPLYVWLPDAMEGPTPVSALIHAATMVTAGVYLIARSMMLLMNAEEALMIIAAVGCLTALVSSVIALTQTDLKRVLAYSTVSQLGYMFMGLGAGVGHLAQFAVVAAMFHLFTHAFFKALLFLAAGSVMHAMGGVIDMRRFGGLRHRLPYTCWTFAVGGLALAGIPPLAGFWSKDEILAGLKAAAGEADRLNYPGWIYLAIYGLAVATAGLTAFYTGRAFFMTFFGPEKLPSPDDPEAESEAHAAATGDIDPHRPGDLPPPTLGATDEPVPQDAHGHGHDQGHGHGNGHEIGHESPPIMWVPLVVLAICAIVVGMAFGPTELFAHHLERTPTIAGLTPGHQGFDYVTAIVGSAVGVLGLALSWWMYARPSTVPAQVARQFGALYRASYLKFGVDTFYDWTVVGPTRVLAAICAFLDTYLVDGLVRLTAWVPRAFGHGVLGPFQNGLIQFYAASTALAVALLLICLLWI